MWHDIHAGVVNVHVMAGAVALAVFWVAMWARKGAARHRSGGRWFERAMYVVSATSLVASVMVLLAPLEVRDPTGAVAEQGADAVQALVARARRGALFLLTLSLLVLASVRHGVMALRLIHVPRILTRPEHIALLVLLTLVGAVSAVVGFRSGTVLLIVFGVLSSINGAKMLVDAFGQPNPAERIVLHLQGMLGAAIGAYTAFFVFGGDRFLSSWLTGYWALVPWLAPAVLGTVAISAYSRRYRRAATAVAA
ncbi:MAG: hypothetical protein AAFX85_06670 [Pseudomonadota bacterium]